LPLGSGAFSARALAMLVDVASPAPEKSVTFVSGATISRLSTRTTTVDAFLRERGITRRDADALSPAPDAPIGEGTRIVYRPAVTVTLNVDGTSRTIVTSAARVADVLASEHIGIGAHDTVKPAPASSVQPDATIAVVHATSWLERLRSAIAPPILHKYDIGLKPGTQRVVDPGAPGTKETMVEVLVPDHAAAPRRLILAAHILRFPRARVVAEGVGDYSALAGIAGRGMAKTMRLADAALKMIATAYTAACSGCSGTTASGRPAGRGIVAVDPHMIPLGTHLFIPGYGHAYAGDTGGSIRGNRIDLGFDSHRDAMSFGRRQIVVYILK
jgi:3D (Asp-Asp-Asp) domain-containing protein